MRIISCLCLSILSTQVFCSSDGSLIDGDLVHRWLIPKLGSANSLCRNHSKFYQEELQSLKLWAAEMFDASAKFPNSILYGSSYALGNFDQCIEIKVPHQNEHFTGKYCMAKLTITPNEMYRRYEHIDYEYGDYETFYNISAWRKMLDFMNDPSKASRNEIYLAYCLPSSCTIQDFEEGLTSMATFINREFNNFSISIDVDKKDCQVKEDYQMPVGDAIFISVITLTFVIVLGCSLYDILSRTENNILPKASGNRHELLLCFSFPKNLKKLASETKNDDGLNCLAGIKVLSLFLIIFGHRCMFNFGSPMINPIFMERVYSKFEAALILNGPIIVDTFFLISGFLASYFILLMFKHSHNIIKIPLIYMHRLIRLTPAYAVVLAFYSTVYVSMGSGPFWQERVGLERERCLESWWTNLLYINNYVLEDKMCMFQSWFITCDMHYFMIIPILAILLKRKPMVGVGAILTLIGGSILIVVATVYVNNEDPILLLYMKLLKDPISSKTFRTIYIPSHMRASPYFVGVLTGYLKYKMKHSAYKLPKWLTRTGWFLAAVISLATIHVGFLFYLPEFSGNILISAIYAGFHHFTFVLGVAWLIIAVSSGRGSLLEPILCWKPFILLSRICYTAFLCHGIIPLHTSAVLRQPIYGSVVGTFHESLADITTAFILGFILSMLFESPVIGIEKIIFGRNKKQGSTANEEDRKRQIDRIRQTLDTPTKSIINNDKIQEMPMNQSPIVHVLQIENSPNLTANGD